MTEKNRQLFYLAGGILAILAFVFFGIGMSNTNTPTFIVSEDMALDYLYETFPEKRKSETQQKVFIEKVSSSYFIALAMIEENSILFAECFEVGENTSISSIPYKANSAYVTKVDPVSCTGL